MPGALVHLLTGSILFGIGRAIFRVYFRGAQKHKKEILLAFVCLTFSLIPDFFLGIYYLTHLEPASILMPYQVFSHLVLTPIAIGVLIPIILVDTKRRPIWIMGASALVLHIILDLFIIETNFLL